MLIYVKGNIFDSKAQTLVNPVNTEGVMGKGLALEFKETYPEMFKEYKKACMSKEFTTGKIMIHRFPEKWIMSFPTKDKWKDPSKLEYIESGLQTFVKQYKIIGITSIAFPKLGCGNGGLDFENEVKPLMDKYLSTLDIPIYVFI